MCVQERLGAVTCLRLAVNHLAVDDDVIVIGGYGLLYFPIYQFLDRFILKSTDSLDFIGFMESIPAQRAQGGE